MEFDKDSPKRDSVGRLTGRDNAGEPRSRRDRVNVTQNPAAPSACGMINRGCRESPAGLEPPPRRHAATHRWYSLGCEYTPPLCSTRYTIHDTLRSERHILMRIPVRDDHLNDLRPGCGRANPENTDPAVRIPQFQFSFLNSFTPTHVR